MPVARPARGVLARTPGLLAIVAMAAIVALAHGLGGPVKTAQPSRQWLNDEVRHQLQLDQQISIVGDPDVASAAQGTDGLPPELRPRLRHQGPARPFVRDYVSIALREAKLAGIRDPKLFVRQIAAESGFQPCAQSGAGALGIAQIMPATAHSWRVDPFIPEDALRAAARHMATYERQYGSYALAAAAYNAGTGAVASYGGVPPYPETHAYVGRIMQRSTPLNGMDHVFRLPAGLTSEFAHRLYGLQRDVRRHGGKVYIGEGWRSYDDQLALWVAAKKKYGGFNGARRWVAPPGCSNHQRGLAADLGGNLPMAHRLAGRHGLVFPMAHESWHVELRGIASQSG